MRGISGCEELVGCNDSTNGSQLTPDTSTMCLKALHEASYYCIHFSRRFLSNANPNAHKPLNAHTTPDIYDCVEVAHNMTTVEVAKITKCAVKSTLLPITTPNPKNETPFTILEENLLSPSLNGERERARP